MNSFNSLVLSIKKILARVPGRFITGNAHTPRFIIPGTVVRVLNGVGLAPAPASNCAMILWFGLGLTGFPVLNCPAFGEEISVAGSASTRPAPTVNRAIPQLAPPHGGLVLSANPTVEEIFSSHIFAEPLVPVGDAPSAAENSALASALVQYSQRIGPDDFSSLTGFIAAHPSSIWNASLLTDLGLEYYNTAHYSLALEAWRQAWSLTSAATNGMGKVIGDRAVGELAAMYARIGRMAELEKLLSSVEGREFVGPATERISGAKAGLSNMKNRPEISFRCGPLALRQIKLAVDPAHPCDELIYKSASTQKGFSLPQVHQLSKEVGLKLQMAFREPGAELVSPAVVHWKVGHYAALIRQAGDRFLVQDPTFRNDVWATQSALESEASGYFLIPAGPLPKGWRAVAATEGESVWGRGAVGGHDPGPHGPCDPKKPGASCDKQKDCPATPNGPIGGMAVPSVHLMLVSLNLVDEPVGYTPPVGPAVRFTVTYNQRDAFQPSIFSYANFGPKWTCHWISYITDNPQSPLADVNYYIMGGGTRTFTGFDTNQQTYAFQQYDHTLLTRTGPASYQMLSPDGSRKVFTQSDGSTGTSRKIFLTQILDPSGNALNLTYDSNLRLAALTDSIGQVTTLAYENAADIYKITKVTDPFGRFATFSYDSLGRLTNITDVIGLNSQFSYQGATDFINTLTTPYGSTLFLSAEDGANRSLETVYPDGDRDRVEFNQSTKLGIPQTEPPQTVPSGMATTDLYLAARNTYYWSKTACSLAYGDYTKAKIYHWLHTADLHSASGILESVKEPLENRVWFDYGGQAIPVAVGTNNLPRHVGRVLDDGTTQLYTYEYDGFGNVTKSVDPVGRTFSYIYDTNGIDLLETRMTRAGANELLEKKTYNGQHLPLTQIDSSGQRTTNTYNPFGQLATETNPKGETTTHYYDSNGYLTRIDGPLPGTNDSTSWTYDDLGRVRTKTDVSSYVVTFDYDPLDRITQITYPDSTFERYNYTRLDKTLITDRAGRSTSFEYNGVRQMTKRTDPLGRVTYFQWCKCGDAKSFTDPLGRVTTRHHDIQGRVTAKEYADGSKITYIYENTIGRLHQRIDEKLQVTQYTYNPDNTLSATTYANTELPTPPIAFKYDPNYNRVIAMTDGSGSTFYSYNPVSPGAVLGANRIARIEGPLQNQTILYAYDELGRRASTSINGVVSSLEFDAASRVTNATNALGITPYVYDGYSSRLASQTLPNGETIQYGYGGNPEDHLLYGITNKLAGAIVSEFILGRDVPRGQISSWSQQSGTQTPSVYSFVYDAADQLLDAAVTNASVLAASFNYTYDLAGNRLTEQSSFATNSASYNALNELTTLSGSTQKAVTNRWDAEHRLGSIVAGSTNTQFVYDGLGRCTGISQTVNGSEISDRRFVWCDNEICEERTPTGSVVKRFFPQGLRIETGTAPGSYYYSRDHLGSVRDLTDSAGNVRARFSYDPFGRMTKVMGDVDLDFGFTGMFWTAEAGLNLTRYRAYNPQIGRWLSRDPLENAELEEDINLFLYVQNRPVNTIDPLGLCCEKEQQAVTSAENIYTEVCKKARADAEKDCLEKSKIYKDGSAGNAGGDSEGGKIAGWYCAAVFAKAELECLHEYFAGVRPARNRLQDCQKRPCSPPCK